MRKGQSSGCRKRRFLKGIYKEGNFGIAVAVLEDAELSAVLVCGFYLYYLLIAAHKGRICAACGLIYKYAVELCELLAALKSVV